MENQAEKTMELLGALPAKIEYCYLTITKLGDDYGPGYRCEYEGDKYHFSFGLVFGKTLLDCLIGIKENLVKNNYYKNWNNEVGK